MKGTISMKKIFAAIVTGLFAMSINVAAFAAEQGSADDATAMVKKAVAFLKANGKEKALAEFNNQSGQFKDRDLYIFVQDMKGKMLAHGGNDKLIGKDLLELKDADGKFFVKNMIEIAGGKGKGWVDYKWTNPSTKAIDQKSSYIEKYEDMFVGCGIYKK
jgi:cytochrome c